MSDSPFLGVADNADLVFLVPTGEIVEDEDGNESLGRSPRRIRAFLKRSGAGRFITKAAGVEESATYYAGFACDPMILPQAVKEGDWAECNLGGKQGFFSVVAINPEHGAEGIGATLEEVAGTRIEGWFQRNRGK